MIRLLTTNFGGLDARYGEWSCRLPRIAAAAVDSDVVVAQAVPLETNSFASLTQALPSHIHIAVAPARAGDSGQALIARAPVLSEQTIELSHQGSHEDTYDRRLLQASFDGDRRLTVLNAHFSWVTRQAHDNVRDTLDYASSLDGDLILAGDFNQKPDSPVAAMLVEAGWFEAWTTLRGISGGETFETGNLWGRLDQVWARGSTIDRVQDIAIIGGDGNAALSDHRGVMVTLA